MVCLTGWYIAVLTLHFYWADSKLNSIIESICLNHRQTQLVKPLSHRKGTEASHHHRKEMFQLSLITEPERQRWKLGKLSARRTIKVITICLSPLSPFSQQHVRQSLISAHLGLHMVIEKALLSQVRTSLFCPSVDLFWKSLRTVL